MTSLNGYGVKLLRQQLGITQDEFAKEIGSKQSLISKIENGTRTLSSILEQRIIYRFNLNESELLLLTNLQRIYAENLTSKK